MVNTKKYPVSIALFGVALIGVGLEFLGWCIQGWPSTIPDWVGSLIWAIYFALAIVSIRAPRPAAVAAASFYAGILAMQARTSIHFLLLGLQLKTTIVLLLAAALVYAFKKRGDRAADSAGSRET